MSKTDQSGLSLHKKNKVTLPAGRFLGIRKTDQLHSVQQEKGQFSFAVPLFI
jgi:hypothetical protein